MLHDYACVLCLQISVDKDEIPLLGGEYVLGYYSTNMQSIIGFSANFQVSEQLQHPGLYSGVLVRCCRYYYITVLFTVMSKSFHPERHVRPLMATVSHWL